MIGRRLAPSLFVVVALLATSCGMVDDPRGGSTSVARMPGEDRRSLTGPDPDGGGVVGASESGQDSLTSTTAVATSTTVPAVPTTIPAAPNQAVPSELSPEDQAAVDRCRRVAAFESAGYALYLLSVGRTEVPSDAIGAVLDAVNGLVPAVSATGDDALQTVLGILEPEARRLMNEPDATVAELQALTERIAPDLTDLLADLMVGCPSAISADSVDQPKRVELGKESL